MSITAPQVAVGTTATKLYGGNASCSVAVRNTGSVPVRLGGPDVTSTTGFPLGADEVVSIDLGPTELLYAAAASATNVTILGGVGK